ncbi:hypothetical protein AAG906_004648 [Vitis piasezkii]
MEIYALIKKLVPCATAPESLGPGWGFLWPRSRVYWGQGQNALSVQPALIENDKKLSEKINILCLMELIFSHPLKIALNIIAESMKLSIANVEYFLMKSLLVHLIEGIVDQTDGLDNDVKFAKLPVSDCG